MTDWIPCTDRLPPLDEIVWLASGDSLWLGSRINADDGWLWGITYGSPRFIGKAWVVEDVEADDSQPDHWSPLPTPPVEEQP
jgi:hypothetical protein